MDIGLLTAADRYLARAKYEMMSSSKSRVSQNINKQFMATLHCKVQWNNGDGDDIACSIFAVENGRQGYYARVVVDTSAVEYNQESQLPIREFVAFALAKTLSERTDDSVIAEIPRGSLALAEYTEYLWIGTMAAINGAENDDTVRGKVKQCTFNVTQYQFVDTPVYELLFVTAEIGVPYTGETLRFVGTAYINGSNESGMVTMHRYDADGKDMPDYTTGKDWHRSWNCCTLDESLFNAIGELAAARLAASLS